MLQSILPILHTSSRHVVLVSFFVATTEHLSQTTDKGRKFLAQSSLKKSVRSPCFFGFLAKLRDSTWAEEGSVVSQEAEEERLSLSRLSEPTICQDLPLEETHTTAHASTP